MGIKMRVTVGEIEERDSDLLGSVVIHDDDYTNLEVALDYLIDNAVQELTLHAVRFEPTAEALTSGEIYPLIPSAVRDFPMARWDRWAKAGIRRSLGGGHENLAEPASADSGVDLFSGDGSALFQVKHSQVVELGSAAEPTDPARRKELAMAAVTQLRPDLDPGQGKGAQRSWNSLVRYAEIYDEHAELLARGSSDAIATLADRHQVEKATVRSWLHRAKEAGIPQALYEVKTESARRGDVSARLDLDVIGQELKEARIAQGKSPDELAMEADIPLAVLLDIENDLRKRVSKDELGIREAIRMIARSLGLDPDPLVKRFDARRPPRLTMYKPSREDLRRAGRGMV